MRNFKILVASLALTSFNTSAKSNQHQLPKLDNNGKPRNVVFILSDDHRYDYMGFVGKVPWLKTPNLDRMAAEGAYIKNAFVTTSLCSPSRASISPAPNRAGNVQGRAFAGR